MALIRSYHKVYITEEGQLIFDKICPFFSLSIWKQVIEKWIVRQVVAVKLPKNGDKRKFNFQPQKVRDKKQLLKSESR